VTEQHDQLGGTVVGPEVRARDIGDVPFAPLGPAAAAMAVPPDETVFSGRVTELATLAAVLAPDRQSDDEPTVCTIAGPAGVGKTTLALRAAAAADAEGWFVGGVLFVDLHGADSALRTDMATAWSDLLRGLGVPDERIPQGEAERAALYRSELADQARAGRPVLVLVDDAAVDDIAVDDIAVDDTATERHALLSLHPGAAPHRMLVTGRQTPHLPGALRIELGALPTEEAVAVLDGAVRAVDPADTRLSDEQAASAELARLCGGLPLALWITAPVVAARRDESITTLVAALSAERDELEELAHDDLVPVRVAFDAALRQLPPEQATLFLLSSLHPGAHIDVEAAAALIDSDTDTTRALLAGLRTAHLVHPTTGDVGYVTHDLLRRLAVERCRRDEPADRRAAAVERLLRHYLTTVTLADSHLEGAAPAPRFTDRDDALAWLDAQRPNLVAAVPAAARDGLDEIAMRLPVALLSYFDLRRHLAEWTATGQFAVAAALRLGDVAGEAAARNSLGLACLRRRRFAEAAEWCRGAAPRYEEVDDSRGLASALTNAGNADHHLRRFAEAVEEFERALSLYRALGDTRGEAVTLVDLAGSYTDCGRFAEALDRYQQAEPLFAAVGDRAAEGAVLADVGNVQLRLGEPDKALDTHRRALALHREIGDRHGEAMALTVLGNDHDAVGEVAEALGCHRQAIELSRELGDRQTEWRALTSLGNVETRRQRYVDAVRAYRQALAICRALGERFEEGQILGNLGMAYSRWGWLTEASAIHRQALASHRRAGNRYGEGVALSELGLLHRALGQWDQASDCYRRSIAAFGAAQAPDDVAQVEELLADLARHPS
jgi:tetratricopeptide (TPR) repeat protein